MPETPEIDRELDLLDAELKRLEAEYNMFFAGRLPRPPVDTRRRVEQMIRRLDRNPLTNYGERFRFSTLQARFVRFTELWDRGLRAREEGRPGPFGVSKPTAAASAPEPGVVRTDVEIEHVVSFVDPLRESAKLRELYERHSRARQRAGEEPLSFERFSYGVVEQVRRLRARGAPEVAVRLTVKAGKVTVTARGLRGAS
ncbi:MAG TPA: hypothetical protein VNK41_05750 [Vicinamibacterales bacterium]|nr:hypothetical protein [Vicinamibacterales bacterium]